MKKYLIFLFISFRLFSFSQNADHNQGELIIRLKDNVDAQRFCSDFQSNLPTGQAGKNSSLNFSTKKLLSPTLNIWLVQFDPNTIAEDEMMRSVKNRDEVRTVQFNHKVTLRSTVPNDLLFSDQYNMLNTGQNSGVIDADIDADEAWDTTTGGLTVQGDTIVVAVIDDGVDTAHKDLIPNFWKNHDEIPNNNLDDDGNGYIDDYLGWNAFNHTDDITNYDTLWGAGGYHGTSVTGIVGAKGNNGKGVTGVNWDVKLMIIPGSGNEAEVVDAYSYALKNRLDYNSSNGTKGAFVVATNSSFGFNFGQPADYPIWCDMYDEMGKAGILSAGATANANWDIDAVGDMPTACPSDFLISVTNTTNMDLKETNAGYGLTTIDLGAPGTGAYTTYYGNSYSAFGGTSGATPHVAGSVALLYAAACESTLQYCKNFPDSGALLFKKYILDGVDTIGDLQNNTVTGGRLNVFNSMKLLRKNQSSNCPVYRNTSIDERQVKNNFLRVFPNPSNETINIIYDTNAPLKISIYNLLGKEVYSFSDEENISRQNQINISSLPAGVYFLSVISKEEKSAVVKLVVY